MEISIENFTGPMDLLLSIVEKENENIYNVNICSVIDQFMETLKSGNQDIESISDFIVFAARLLEIKAYMLLPPGEETEPEENPAEELIQHLVNYKTFKLLSYKLLEYYKKAGMTVVRESTLEQIIQQYKKENKEEMVKQAVGDITVKHLAYIFSSLMEEKKKRGDPERPKSVQMKKDDAPFEEIKRNVTDYILNRHSCHFSEIPVSKRSRNSKIMSFLSILELCKEGSVSLEQEGNKILIENRSSLS